MIAHVRGSIAENNATFVDITVNSDAGNCLMVTIGYFGFFQFAQGTPVISDTANNAWLPGPMTLNVDGTLKQYQLFTYIAQNCVGGSTDITFSYPNNSNGRTTIAVDEYSGVASIQALDNQSFAANMGTSSIDTTSISALSGEMLYSAAMVDPDGTTFTPSAGWTARQYSSVQGSVLGTFDKAATTGTFNNVITFSETTTIGNAIILALSPTPIDRNIVQWAFALNDSISTTSTTAVFPYPNTAGNLLVACGNFYERLGPSFTDTQDNIWNVVYGSGIPPTDTFAVGYAVNCKSGSNSVTLSATTGGDDNSFELIIAEYSGVKGGFTNSSYGGSAGSLVTSVNTGDVSVAMPNSLLISFWFGQPTSSSGISGYPPVSSTGTRRFQMCSSGQANESNFTLAIADQIGTMVGNYSDTFSISPESAAMESAILGFQFNFPLTITANDQSKNFGDLFTFKGTEFTSVGLLPGDSITSVTLTSAGAPADAAVGTYPIVPSDAVGVGLDKYMITYVNGTMTVNVDCYKVPWPLTTFIYPDGAPLSNGYILIKLVYDCNCPCADYQILGNVFSKFSLDEDGILIPNLQVRPNDQLKPDNSYYILEAYASNGQLVLGPRKVTIFSTHMPG